MNKQHLMSKDKELIVTCSEGDVHLYRRWGGSRYHKMKLDTLNMYTKEYCGIRIYAVDGNVKVSSRDADGNYKIIDMKTVPETALHVEEGYIDIKTRYYVSDIDARLYISYTSGIPSAFLKNADSGEYESQILILSSWNNQECYKTEEYIIIPNDDGCISVIAKNVRIHMHEIPLTAVNDYQV